MFFLGGPGPKIMLKIFEKVLKKRKRCEISRLNFNKLGIRRGRGGLPHIYLILPFSLLSLPPRLFVKPSAPRPSENRLRRFSGGGGGPPGFTNNRGGRERREKGRIRYIWGRPPLPLRIPSLLNYKCLCIHGGMVFSTRTIYFFASDRGM